MQIKEIITLKTFYIHIGQKMPADFENSGRPVFMAFAMNIFLLRMWGYGKTLSNVLRGLWSTF